ncbi:hypothetical protein EVAR_103311_1 [Eumeta japonica]|uniref:Uncharacterized protein n=1 Tax=Eumeta variegata TaxID=151549 RepID=A0A4C1XTB3_EUMVA|nr:hypothetical protein EVAR_103311_1 [Eumeta japonica]
MLRNVYQNFKIQGFLKCIAQSSKPWLRTVFLQEPYGLDKRHKLQGLEVGVIQRPSSAPPATVVNPRWIHGSGSPVTTSTTSLYRLFDDEEGVVPKEILVFCAPSSFSGHFYFKSRHS